MVLVFSFWFLLSLQKIHLEYCKQKLIFIVNKKYYVITNVTQNIL